jgi:hypothetical protein
LYGFETSIHGGGGQNKADSTTHTIFLYLTQRRCHNLRLRVLENGVGRRIYEPKREMSKILQIIA